MGDESTEIFDDLYLGLRAGGALRKQRRGEPLTTEEQEALGRWQRLGHRRRQRHGGTERSGGRGWLVGAAAANALAEPAGRVGEGPQGSR